LIDVSRCTLQDKIMGTVMIHDPQAKFPDFDPTNCRSQKFGCSLSPRSSS